MSWFINAGSSNNSALSLKNEIFTGKWCSLSVGADASSYRVLLNSRYSFAPTFTMVPLYGDALHVGERDDHAEVDLRRLPIGARLGARRHLQPLYIGRESVAPTDRDDDVRRVGHRDDVGRRDERLGRRRVAGPPRDRDETPGEDHHDG